MTTARGTGQRAWRRSLRGVLLAIPSMIVGAACSIDSPLDVELPGVVEAEQLNDPTFARTLVRSARGDFGCALNSYVWWTNAWTTSLHETSGGRANNALAIRSPVTRSLDQLFDGGFPTHCRQPEAMYGPLHVARAQAVNAITLIEGFDQADLQDEKDFLLGEAYLYMGYSIELLAEAFCELTFDAGPLETREQGFMRADQAFQTAHNLLSGITSGPNVARATELLNAALIGRARANLNLGDGAKAVDFANRVPVGFAFVADREPGSSQTENLMYNRSSAISYDAAVAEPWHNLTVQGVPDPRVRVEHIGVGLGTDGITDIWIQLKYTSAGDDIPFATWREAQLMIAEVQQGQAAVDIINMLRDTYSLPYFSSTDPVEIRNMVIGERKRELWLQGVRIGDMLRLDLPWEHGLSPKGDPYGEDECVPLPFNEVLGNPYLSR